MLEQKSVIIALKFRQQIALRENNSNSRILGTVNPSHETCAPRREREKTVYSTTHKTAINRPTDNTGEM